MANGTVKVSLLTDAQDQRTPYKNAKKYIRDHYVDYCHKYYGPVGLNCHFPPSGGEVMK